MSVPEAKQNVLDAIESCREALTALDSADDSAVGKYKKALEETIELLEGLKEKVFLKTKKALTPAYLVLEACKNVADLADDLDSDDEDSVGELGDAVNQLKESVSKLQGASKQHSVIVT